MHTFTVEVLTPASEGGLTWKSGSYRRNHFRGGHSETGGPSPTRRWPHKKRGHLS